jgi:hypothetical protein
MLLYPYSCLAPHTFLEKGEPIIFLPAIWQTPHRQEIHRLTSNDTRYHLQTRRIKDRREGKETEFLKIGQADPGIVSRTEKSSLEAH